MRNALYVHSAYYTQYLNMMLYVPAHRIEFITRNHKYCTGHMTSHKSRVIYDILYPIQYPMDCILYAICHSAYVFIQCHTYT